MNALNDVHGEYILGIGCDVLEINRIGKLNDKQLMLLARKILHKDELAEFESYLKECRAKLGEKPWIWRSVLRLIFAL